MNKVTFKNFKERVKKGTLLAGCALLIWGGSFSISKAYSKNFSYNQTFPFYQRKNKSYSTQNSFYRNYPFVAKEVIGEVLFIKEERGPTKRGYPWTVVYVRDKSTREVISFGIGPSWWGVPSIIKEGAEIKISGVKPPIWLRKNIPYFMACSVESLQTKEVYNLRYCIWCRGFVR